MNDIFAAISELGTNAPSANQEAEIKTVTTKNDIAPNQVTESISEPEAKDDKPGYVSLVIPNSLKKKWKLFSTVHGMSLTDCLKLGMKLLEEMEMKGTIKIEDGFLTIKG